MRRRGHQSNSHSCDSRGWHSQRGFTLVEIMITVVVASLGVMGLTALFSDMAKIQKKAATSQMLGSFRGAITSAVTSESAGVATAWGLSIADGDGSTGNPEAVHRCLFLNTDCTKDTSALFNLKNNDGSELFYSRTATRGFTLDGALCNTFSVGTPDPGCPFRWEIRTTNRCTGTDKPACSNPIVEVEGILLYSPGANDPLGSGLNPATYRIIIRRGDKKDKNEPVVITYVEGSVADDSTGEAGSCFNTWYARKFNTIASDPAGNVVSVAADSFTLKPGTYECRVQAPAFKNGGNTLRFLGTGVSIYSGVASASLSGDSVMVTMQANFHLNANTSLQVLHKCTNQPSEDPYYVASGKPNGYMLGVPAPRNTASDYRDVTYTIVSCVKTSG